MSNNLSALLDILAGEELKAVRSDNQALLDALVIASAALKDAGKIKEAEVVDKAIYLSTQKKLFRERILNRLSSD